MTNENTHAPGAIAITDHDGIPAPLSERSRLIASGASGAAVGAAIGTSGGPVGIVVGMVLGAAVGLLSRRAGREGAMLAAHEEATLDAEIGVTGGDIGAPSLREPPLFFERRSEVEFFGGSRDLSEDVGATVQEEEREARRAA